jgi:sigma-B regulation protein RsbQ
MLARRNNINIRGQGSETIIFIHGYGCDQNMWRFVKPPFEERYKVVLIDLVGSGGSDESAYCYEKYSKLEGYVADIVEICETFKFEYITLVGHSVSAIIAGLATIQRPDLFKKLVMVSPSPRYVNELESGYIGGFEQSDIEDMLCTLKGNYLGWSSAIAPTIIGTPNPPEFSTELANSFCRNNPDIAAHFAALTFTGDNRADLKHIKVPTLIIQCSQDLIAPMEVGIYVHDQIKGSILKVLDTSGHCPHLTAPEATIAALSDFLSIDVTVAR